MKVDGLLQEAIRFHRLGSLAEAERLYALILQQDPDHADALHLLGVMACKVGRYQGAMDCISKAPCLRTLCSCHAGTYHFI